MFSIIIHTEEQDTPLNGVEITFKKLFFIRYRFSSSNGRSITYIHVLTQPLPKHKISLGPTEMQLDLGRNSIFISPVFTKNAQ